MNMHALGLESETNCTASKVEFDDLNHVFIWGYLCASVVNFEVFKVVLLRISFCCDVTSCLWIMRHRYFKAT
jgi:hypothetical protein